MREDGSDPESESGGEQEAEGQEGADGHQAGVREVEWSVPDGFTLGDEPDTYMYSTNLVGEYVYMRWEKYGWQLGKINGVITNANPRLYKKFNFRVTWADGSKGPCKLDVHSYAHGSDARLNSWVILKEDL